MEAWLIDAIRAEDSRRIEQLRLYLEQIICEICGYSLAECECEDYDE